MDLPQPPQEQELKNIIDKLAQFVARNGAEFEQMTKTKQSDNPKFSFLFGGEYFNYYQYKVTTEQAILKHRQSREQNQMQQQSSQMQQPSPQMQQPSPQMQQQSSQMQQPSPQMQQQSPQMQQPSQMHQNSMVGNFQGPSGPRFNSQPYPFQQQQQQQPYPNPPGSSGYGGGGDSGPFPPNGGMGGSNFHQQQHPYPMPPPPGSEPPVPTPSVTQNFRPPFPSPEQPPFSGPYNQHPNSSDNVYNQQSHFNQPSAIPENFNSQPNSIIVPPGTEISHSGSNGFQQHSGPPLPPTPIVASVDSGSVPVVGSATSMNNSMPGMKSKMETISFQQHQLRDQIKQSELNLVAQRRVIDQQISIQIKEAVYIARGEVLKKEAQDIGLNIQEFDDVLSPITESCTKDSIWSGKHFIFTNALSDQNNKWISRYLLYKSTSVTGPFVHKLYIIYLMNDVLHHCMRKNADGLKDQLEKVLAPMYCHAVSSASDEQKSKLDKLLNLWESKIHLEEELLDQLHSPKESWIEFEKGMLEEFPQVVSTVTQHLNNTFDGYQQQHNTFIQHATKELQQLDQQKTHLEQQQQQQQQQQHQALPPVPSGNFGPMIPGPPFMQGGPPSGPPQPMGQGLDFNQPPPGFPPGAPVIPLVDFSKPPPGFADEQQKENLIPTVPYFELPAGLMAPLIKMDDSKYKPIDPSQLRLPLPVPPSERLLRAVENFYISASHEQPRNCEGWEQLALYDYYKAKSSAIKEKERLIQEENRPSSRSPSPVVIEHQFDMDDIGPQQPYRRYRSISPEIEEELPAPPPPPVPVEETPRRRHSPSPERKLNYRRSITPPPLTRFRPSPPSSYPRRSRSKSRSKTRSKSRSPPRSSSRSSSSRSRSRSKSPLRIPFRKSRSRSITPPSFGMPTLIHTGVLDESNKGHQMLRSMGWSGTGLGANEQGIVQPIAAAEVRSSPQEIFRGLGVPSAQSDPYEAFRKNKGQAFINRMKARAEEKH